MQLFDRRRVDGGFGWSQKVAFVRVVSGLSYLISIFWLQVYDKFVLVTLVIRYMVGSIFRFPPPGQIIF